MNRVLTQVTESSKKKFNKDILEGVAKKYLYQALEFIDGLIKNNIDNLNPSVGLSYLGYRRLDPYEEYKLDVDNNKYDIARNYLYKAEFKFNLRGEDFSRILALPFVEENGAIMYLSDTAYTVVPVLTEYSINPTGNEIFIRLLKDKIIAKRLDKNYVKNGQITRLSYIHGKVYKLKTAGIYDRIPLALYLFYKDGIKNTFKERAGVDVIFTEDETEANKYRETHNIYETTGTKPKNIRVVNYSPYRLKILIPKDQDNVFVQNLIAGLISSIDMYPDLARSRFLKEIGTKNEQRFWKILLGKIIFKGQYEIYKIIENMDTHLTLLNSYLDISVKNKLKEIGVYVNDFYDLLAYILKNFINLTMNSEKRSGDINNRYVEIIYYILFNIITGVNKTFFKINESNNKKPISMKEINNIFSKELSIRKIYNIIKSNGVNISVMPVDYTADNLYPKISAILEDQNRGSGVKRSKENAFPNYTKQVRAEDAIIGSLLYLPKKSPTPRIRINPFVEIDFKTGKFKLDEYEGMMEKINHMLQGKIDDEELLSKIEVEIDDKTEGV